MRAFFAAGPSALSTARLDFALRVATVSATAAIEVISFNVIDVIFRLFPNICYCRTGRSHAPAPSDFPPRALCPRVSTYPPGS